jgi:hypothetical protein
MRIFLLVTLMVALAACGRCAEPPGDPASGSKPAVGGDGAVARDAPKPGAVYKEAYERARSEVTADNARDRLEELERAIDREAEAVP